MRTGRADHGPEYRRLWFAELEEVRRFLRAMGELGDILEPAAGTGLWTVEMMGAATSIHCVDASPEVLEINRWRCVGDARISYDVADLFTWRPDRVYDTVALGFWLSHVPDDLLNGFLAKVLGALRPGGRAFFVDSLGREPTSTNRDQVLENSGESTRRLNDGREFRIVKVFRGADQFRRLLAPFGEVDARETEAYFVFGRVTRAL